MSSIYPFIREDTAHTPAQLKTPYTGIQRGLLTLRTQPVHFSSTRQHTVHLLTQATCFSGLRAAVGPAVESADGRLWQVVWVASTAVVPGSRAGDLAACCLRPGGNGYPNLSPACKKVELHWGLQNGW